MARSLLSFKGAVRRGDTTPWRNTRDGVTKTAAGEHAKDNISQPCRPWPIDTPGTSVRGAADPSDPKRRAVALRGRDRWALWRAGRGARWSVYLTSGRPAPISTGAAIRSIGLSCGQRQLALVPAVESSAVSASATMKSTLFSVTTDPVGVFVFRRQSSALLQASITRRRSTPWTRSCGSTMHRPAPPSAGARADTSRGKG